MLKKSSITAAMAFCLIAAAGSASVTQGAATGPQIQFTDTKGHWAEGAIQNAVLSGFVDGYPDGTFKPDADISRAEFIKLLATVTGTKAVSVEGANWYQSYVNALKQRQILRDDDFTDFNAPMNRLEMVKLVMRETREDIRNPEAITSDEAYMFNAVKSGIIQGLPGGELGTEEKTTRAQALTLLERMNEFKKGKKLEVDRYALSKADVALTGSNMRTMIGKAPKISFPYTQKLGDGFTLTINSMTIVDMTDPDEPLYNYIKQNAKTGSASLDGKLVFLFDMTYENLQDTSETSYSHNHAVALMGFGRIILPNSLTGFTLEAPQKINGVNAVIYDKEKFLRKIEENTIKMDFRTPGGLLELY